MTGLQRNTFSKLSYNFLNTSKCAANYVISWLSCQYNKNMFVNLPSSVVLPISCLWDWGPLKFWMVQNWSLTPSNDFFFWTYGRSTVRGQIRIIYHQVDSIQNLQRPPYLTNKKLIDYFFWRTVSWLNSSCLLQWQWCQWSSPLSCLENFQQIKELFYTPPLLNWTELNT